VKSKEELFDVEFYDTPTNEIDTAKKYRYEYISRKENNKND